MVNGESANLSCATLRTDESKIQNTKSVYRIGLTGNIATGKSTVGRMLVELGAELIDADRVAHTIIAPGSAAYTAVIDAFGEDIIAADGTIDRGKLGGIVFTDAGALARLETLVHPPTIAEVERRAAESHAPVVVIEAIKLLESGMADTYDAIWVTTCSETEQLARLMAIRHLTREDALRRIQAQPPQLAKIAQADMVIDTNGTLAETRAQVIAGWQQLHRIS